MSTRFVKKIIISVLLIACIVFLGIRYTLINNQYPNPSIKIVKKGNEVNIGDFSYTLVTYKWYNGNLINSINPNYVLLYDVDGNKYSLEDTKVILAVVEVKNNSAYSQNFDVTNFSFEIGAWHNQWDLELYNVFNNSNKLSINMNSGDSQLITLPIVMNKFQFKESKWETLEQQYVDIVITYYPEKWVLRIED